MTKARKSKIVYDGDEMRNMRLLIPSMRQKGKPMSKSELADVIGFSFKGVYLWETNGGTKANYYTLKGVLSAVMESFSVETNHRDLDEIQDELETLQARKQMLSNRLQAMK